MSIQTFIDECVEHPDLDVDPVKFPAHYNQGDIECIDALRSALGDEGFVGFCVGNVIKYLWRYRHKGGVEDLRKAEEYLQWSIAVAGRSDPGGMSHDADL
jgi:hypothetical protein